MLRRPSTAGLTEELQEGARAVGLRLAKEGWRGWIVGGAVRDLVLGRSPKDLDMVSGAPPEVVEDIFDWTLGVGRAFGILIVRAGGVQLELATFRTESGYSDARRPDKVCYAETPEEDARRRDFTCNALYLDPLTDELLDPCGGMEDLKAGRLRTVGDARDRFTEDGLRLLRMARIGALLGLDLAPGLAEAAAQSVGALEGVSPERVRVELEGCLKCGAPDRALELLAAGNLVGAVLPWLVDPAGTAASLDRVRALLAQLGEAAAGPAGWAVLLGGGTGEDSGLDAEGTLESVLERAQALRFSKSERLALGRTVDLASRWQALSQEGVRTSERILASREEPWRPAWQLARARVAEDARPALDDLATWRESLTPEVLRPAPLVTAADLEHAGIPRGPRWSALLAQAEAACMDGDLRDPGDVPAWVAARAEANEA